MKLFKHAAWALAGLCLLAAAPALAADNVTVTVGSGKSMGCKEITAVCYSAIVGADASTGAAATLAKDSSVDGLEGYVDGIEALIGTTNTTLSTISGYLSDPATNPTPATGAGCTPSGTQSAASTNSTNVKASAALLCGGQLINTTTTLYYLRLYNLASAPTCSSATGFVFSVPVPPAAAAGGANGITVNVGTYGLSFTTGLSFCLTGGATSTDNTSAATGVFVNLAYK